MSITEDRNDPKLNQMREDGQQESYLVLPELDKRERIRPWRNKYTHKICGVETRMPDGCADTFTVNPKFYGATFCVSCKTHRPVNEFLWSNTEEEVGS